MSLILATAFAANVQASPILAGQTVSTSVNGNSSIYQVFGHSGTSGGGGLAGDAVQLNFAAGANNTFHFSVSGLVGCCGGVGSTQADGSTGTSNVQGQNGLSGASGNSWVPLLGVFTSNVDPFGSAAPATLSWNVNSPASLAPQLNQVFYIGDGKSGYLNAAGATLNFLAPGAATRLYLGVADGWGLAGPSGYYFDNVGKYAVNVELAAPAAAVPEPASLCLLGLGLAGLIASRRRGR